MAEHEWIAEAMAANRAHLRAVAYRMLGSSSEAEDALQEAWLRVSRADASAIENPTGWLTTIVARVCLDMLRSRKSRREELAGAAVPERADAATPAGADAESELALADSVGLALLVVLETLPPPERVAFVLHDLFDLPFDEIARIVDRTPTAARQLASRARRRVHGASASGDADVGRQRALVEAFLRAARGGDLQALLAILDPDVVARTQPAPGAPVVEVRGAEQIARQAIRAGARAARIALVGGKVGAVVAPGGKLLGVLDFTVEGERIVAVEFVADPERLDALELAVLEP